MQTHLVLSVGSDPDLMKTRSLILLQAHYAVRNAYKVSDALQIFRAGDFDLVLICHTVPEPERLKLIENIRKDRPSAKIVVIRNDGELSARMADETIHSLDGAEQLLSAIAHALRKPRRAN